MKKQMKKKKLNGDKANVMPSLPSVDEIMSEWMLVGVHKPYWMNAKWDRQTRAMLEWILEKAKRQ